MYIGVQGEICGPHIQRNLLNLAERSFFIFRITDVQTRKILPYPQWIEVCEELGLPHVLIEMDWDNYPMDISINKLKRLANGKYKGTDNYREGLVFQDKEITGLSFKVINEDYRLTTGSN